MPRLPWAGTPTVSLDASFGPPGRTIKPGAPMEAGGPPSRTNGRNQRERRSWNSVRNTRTHAGCSRFAGAGSRNIRNAVHETGPPNMPAIAHYRVAGHLARVSLPRIQLRPRPRRDFVRRPQRLMPADVRPLQGTVQDRIVDQVLRALPDHVR